MSLKYQLYIMKTQDNNDILAYWLSNASTLLLLLQRTLKASGAAGMAPQRRRSSSATLFGRMTQVSVYDGILTFVLLLGGHHHCCFSV